MRSPGMTGRPGLSRRTPGRPGSRNACAVSPAHSKVNGIQSRLPGTKALYKPSYGRFPAYFGPFFSPVSRGTYCAKAGVLLVVMWSAADDSAEGVTIRVAAKGKANERISQVARRNRETSRRDRGLTRRAVARAVSPAVRARW